MNPPSGGTNGSPGRRETAPPAEDDDRADARRVAIVIGAIVLGFVLGIALLLSLALVGP